MKQRDEDDRAVFRLDFALRGHVAYTQPLSLERLIELVEGARTLLGAPLLQTHESNHAENQSNTSVPRLSAPGTVIECRTRFGVRERV